MTKEEATRIGEEMGTLARVANDCGQWCRRLGHVGLLLSCGFLCRCVEATAARDLSYTRVDHALHGVLMLVIGMGSAFTFIGFRAKRRFYELQQKVKAAVQGGWDG